MNSYLFLGKLEDIGGPVHEIAPDTYTLKSEKSFSELQKMLRGKKADFVLFEVTAVAFAGGGKVYEGLRSLFD